MADVTQSTPVFGRLRSTANRLVNGLRDYRTYRATRVELEQLSDRELDDLGLTRHSLDQVAVESVYGRRA